MNLSWQQIPSPIITEIISEHYDGTVLDTEHGCFNNEALWTCIQVLKLQKKKAFVRLKDISKPMIGMCLDAGADGLIFSTVETREQAKKIIEYSLFPPYGKRGLGLVRQNRWGNDMSHFYPNNIKYENRPFDPILIPQIESKKAVNNLKDIMTDLFDYYLIGPYDLSLSLNIPGKFDNPEFIDYINKIRDLIPEKKRGIHIPKQVNMQIGRYRRYGLLCLGMDTISLMADSKRNRDLI